MYASFSSNNYDLIFLSFVGGLSLPRQDNFLCLVIKFVCSALAAIYSPAAGKIALKQGLNMVKILHYKVLLLPPPIYFNEL